MYKVLLREGQGRIPHFLLRTAPRGSAMRRVYESGNCILMKDKEMKRTVLEDPKADIICREYVQIQHLPHSILIESVLVSSYSSQIKTVRLKGSRVQHGQLVVQG